MSKKVIKTKIKSAIEDEINIGTVVVECITLESDVGKLVYMDKNNKLNVYDPHLVLDREGFYQIAFEVLDEVEENLSEFLTSDNKLKRKLAKRIIDVSDNTNLDN